MVSESELIGRIREFLGSSDLTTTTTSTVRRQLESDFGIDLSDRKAFIREQVDSFLQSVNQQSEDEEPQNDDVVEDADKPEPSQGSGSKEENEEEEVEEGVDNEKEEEAEERPKRTRSVKKKNTKSKKRLDNFYLLIVSSNSFRLKKKTKKNIAFDFLSLYILCRFLILFWNFFI